MSSSFVAAVNTRTVDTSPKASPTISLCNLDVDILRNVVAILMETSQNGTDDLPAAVSAVRVVDKQFRALVRATLPVRVLFRGRLNLVLGEQDSGEEDSYDYVYPDLEDPEGMTERLYGHLDIWPEEAQGICKVGGLYTYSEDYYSDGAIARAFNIRGNVAHGRMMLRFAFTNTCDPSDDDGLGASICVESVQPAQRTIHSWNCGLRRARCDFELHGSFTVNWPSESHPGGDATLSLKALHSDAFNERTRFKWVKKSRAEGSIGYRVDNEETRAEAMRLWRSRHPSLLTRAERSDLPLFSGWF